MISRQRRLRKLKLVGYNNTPTNTISAIADLSKTLLYLEIVHVNFRGNRVDSPSLKGLAKCKLLEILVIKNCTFANEDQLVPLSKAHFPKLHTIHIDESTHGLDKLIISIIMKSRSTLEHVFFKPHKRDTPHSTKIIKTVAENCPNLKTLGVPIGIDRTPNGIDGISHLRDLFKNPKCQLESLSLFPGNHSTAIAHELPSLGSLMPPTLRHLNLFMDINNSSMKQFLDKTSVHLKTLWVNSWKVQDKEVCDIVEKYLNRINPDNLPKIKEFLQKKIALDLV